MDCECLKLVIDYMYTGEVLITELNVQSLLTTSNLLNISNLKQSCSQFIQSQLDVTNCIGIREFADLHSCQVLVKYADAFIDQYFGQVCLKEEFLSLNVQQLTQLVSKDTLAVSSEKIVYDSIIRWINYDFENRHKHLAKLMENVRLCLLKHEELVHISEEAIIKKDLLCMELIVEAFQYKMVKSSNDELTKFQANFEKTRAKPRVALGLPKVVFFFSFKIKRTVIINIIS